VGSPLILKYPSFCVLQGGKPQHGLPDTVVADDLDIKSAI